MQYIGIATGYPYEQRATEARVYYSRTSAPASEPLTIDEAVRHLQLAAGCDNAYVEAMIQVARNVTENATGVALTSSGWMAATAIWQRCGMIAITMGPVSAVESISYYAQGDTTLTVLDPSNYTLASAVSPAVIVFSETFAYPALENRPDAVQISFTTGYAMPALIPPSLKHAVRILVRHFYDNAEAAQSVKFSELPFGVRHLLESNRASGWVA